MIFKLFYDTCKNIYSMEDALFPLLLYHFPLLFKLLLFGVAVWNPGENANGVLHIYLFICIFLEFRVSKTSSQSFLDLLHRYCLDYVRFCVYSAFNIQFCLLCVIQMAMNYCA